MVRLFRFLGLAEGLSFLLLLLIAMPLKYMAGMPKAVSVVGMAHGVLFIAYVLLAIRVYAEQDWPPRRLALAWAAAVVPFGTFLFDRKFLRPVDAQTA